MDLTRVLRQPIIVEHVTQDGPPDEFGDPTEERTWTRFLGYVWQTTVPNERTANASLASEEWELALERAASGNVDAGDRIVASGELDEDGELVPNVGEPFDLAGPPWPALNPRTQLLEYVHARLVRSSW
jgi:hypothetical protein